MGNTKRPLAVLSGAAVILMVMAIGFMTVRSYACSGEDIYSGLSIYGYSPLLVTCTTTTTINGTSTSTSTVNGTTPYQWGAWVAILLLLAVIIAFYYIRKSAKV